MEFCCNIDFTKQEMILSILGHTILFEVKKYILFLGQFDLTCEHFSYFKDKISRYKGTSIFGFAINFL
jgi:hypothetical protein